jgi:hypothetical protein
MTPTLEIPSLEWRFLEAVNEEVESKPVRDWPPKVLEWSLDSLRKWQEVVTDLRGRLEELLSEGVEASYFAHSFRENLAVIEKTLENTRRLTELTSKAEDAASTRVADESRRLETEIQAFHHTLAQALSLASVPRPPLDRERARRVEEAYARGKTKPFGRP